VPPSGGQPLLAPCKVLGGRGLPAADDDPDAICHIRAGLRDPPPQLLSISARRTFLGRLIGSRADSSRPLLHGLLFFASEPPGRGDPPPESAELAARRDGRQPFVSLATDALEFVWHGGFQPSSRDAAHKLVSNDSSACRPALLHRRWVPRHGITSFAATFADASFLMPRRAVMMAELRALTQQIAVALSYSAVSPRALATTLAPVEVDSTSLLCLAQARLEGRVWPLKKPSLPSQPFRQILLGCGDAAQGPCEL